MGTWRITVSGHGIHHNGRRVDANELAKGLVESLLASGHGVSEATFVLTNGDGSAVGQAENLLDDGGLGMGGSAASQGGYIGSSGETDPGEGDEGG